MNKSAQSTTPPGFSRPGIGTSGGLGATSSMRDNAPGPSEVEAEVDDELVIPKTLML